MTYIEQYPKLKFHYTDKKDGLQYYSLKTPMIYWYKGVKYELFDNEFLFNFASVPKALRKFYKPDKKDIKYPSIVHDYDYSNRYTKRLKDDLKLYALQKSEQVKFANILPTLKDRILKKIDYLIQRLAVFLLLRLFGAGNKAR